MGGLTISDIVAEDDGFAPLLGSISSGGARRSDIVVRSISQLCVSCVAELRANCRCAVRW